MADELTTPATEADIGEVLIALQSFKALALTVRRLAFERDRLKQLIAQQERNPEHEALAAEFRKHQLETADGKPEGTLESLERCANMLDTYGPDCFPANDKGQVHFARAMMESTADEIRAFIAAPQDAEAEGYTSPPLKIVAKGEVRWKPVDGLDGEGK